MTLFAYQQRTQLLLNDLRQQIFNLADLKTYVNLARTQVAGETECCRSLGGLTLTPDVMAYDFTSISVDDPAYAGVINVRSVSWQNLAPDNLLAAITVHTRPFEWFQYFELSNPVATSGPPRLWAQFKQAFGGSIYVNSPDDAYVLRLDTVCLPINLDDDTTAEGIPILWRSAVPYYAAYQAFLGNMQEQEAEKMFSQYARILEFGRRAANPSQLPGLYLQSKDPTLGNKLGVAPPRQGG